MPHVLMIADSGDGERTETGEFKQFLSSRLLCGL